MTISRYIRKGHSVIAMLWLLSLVLTLAVPAASEQLPGPSIPGLLFVATVITGIYLLAGPWIRGNSTVPARLRRLKDWNIPRPAILRRTHRIIASLFLLLLIVGLSLEAVDGVQSQVVVLPIVVLLFLLVITGGYMFFRPWVARFRAG